jgi:predicted regulator of Ras-like GTPase activity (Roadblock/LC7/MglB family)
MTLTVDSGVKLTLSPQNSANSYISDILGVAIFDVNGLPREYFTTPESNNMNWVQTVFQSLGLKSLLMSSLRVDGFRQAVIRTVKHSAIVIKQRDHYIALLMPNDEDLTFLQSQDFADWIDEFEANILRSHPRFSAV